MAEPLVSILNTRRGRRLTTAVSDIESALEEIQFLQSNPKPDEDAQAFEWAISRLDGARSILKGLKGESAT
jgi:hypothetical protein